MAEDTDGECAMKWQGGGGEAHFQLGASWGSPNLEDISAGSGIWTASGNGRSGLEWPVLSGSEASTRTASARGASFASVASMPPIVGRAARASIVCSIVVTYPEPSSV